MWHPLLRWTSYAASVVAVGVILSSCEKQQEIPAELPAMTYHDSTIVVHSEGCGDPNVETQGPCCDVEIKIPVFHGGSKGAADSVNRRIRAYYVSILGYGSPSDTAMPDILDASKNLMTEFSDFQKDMPESPAGWEVMGTCTVMCIDSIVSARLESYSYLGGAHGISDVQFVVAKAASGDTLNPLDLVTDRAAFTAEAERAFRAAVGMKAEDADYGSQGYWFKDNVFVLPASIGISKDSVHFNYNPYEIAPYSMGSISFALPRTALK